VPVNDNTQYDHRTAVLFGSLQLSQLRASAPKLKSNDRTVVSSVSLQLSQLHANAPNLTIVLPCHLFPCSSRSFVLMPQM